MASAIYNSIREAWGSAAAPVETGYIDIPTLTPYASGDPNGVLTAGTVLAGTMALGAVQVYTDGAYELYSIPRGSDGATFDQAVPMSHFKLRLNKAATLPSDSRTILAGIVVSSGAVGSGPDGAPNDPTEVDRWMLFGIEATPADMVAVEPSGTLTVDSTGSAEADTIAIEGTTDLTGYRLNAGAVELDRQNTLQILTGGAASPAGDVTRTPATELWAPGDAIAFMTLVFRGGTISASDSHSFNGWFDILQRSFS